ncbi:uncharacterized protein LOC123308719 [Coccinella septempunctata]|uniref:uncharacterized protein LOC123308719 n=1 Tax=Coccinella septempunctata TaxID=41139 RepID=UPI001D0702B8|nr:uncharacterized protein LOC123308719 [Coccinella septempunctata]
MPEHVEHRKLAHSRPTLDSREVDEHARYENYKREGKSNGVANGEDLETGKTDYFMHYLPVPLDSKSDGGVVLQRKRAKYSINDKKNIPNKRKGKSGSGASDKEYFFNPDFPFTFLGSYPGTDGWNDTLIMHENSYTSHDDDVPTVQEISTRTVHFHDDFGPHDVDKEAILDFVANFPWPGWCYPEQDEEEAGTCCETHEDCEDRIEPSEEKFGLENKSLFKRLHCACEFNFFKCLKGNGDVISNSLGVAYFNIIAPKCFASEQRISCLSRNRWKKCVKYGYDQKSKKGYQWVDTPTY